MSINDLLDQLKDNGYRITEQRKAIVQVLVINITKLISVEKLLSESKKIYTKTNMSTVYRNLESLQNLGIVQKVTIKDGVAMYKLTCSEEHHHHMICKRCGKTEIIDYCPLMNLEQISKEKKFKLTGHTLELFGYCVDCKDVNQD